MVEYVYAAGIAEIVVNPDAAANMGAISMQFVQSGIG